MALQDKYSELISTAKTAGVQDLQVREQNNVLYIDGQAPSEAVKKQLWDVYNRIDPDYRSADVVMNVRTPAAAAASPVEYEVRKGDNLTKIGKQFGVSWQEIFEVNKDKIKNPDLIQPGWKLKIPGKPKA
jgi:nucleoid-associated protein YgaU